MVRVIIVAALVFGALAAEEQPVASGMITIRVSQNASAQEFIEAMCSATGSATGSAAIQVDSHTSSSLRDPGSDLSPLAAPTTTQLRPTPYGPFAGAASPADSDTLSIIDLVPGMYLGSKT